jgi:hypothetical protein
MENPVESNEFELNPIKYLKRIRETDHLDYKKEITKDKVVSSEIVKDCAAMANTGGGLLIFGVNKDSLEGVNDSNNLYDTSTISNLLKNYLSPNPKIFVDTIEYDGLVFKYLIVNSIERYPIIVSKDLHDSKGRLLLQPGDLFIRENTKTIKVSNESHCRRLLEKAININTSERFRSLQNFQKDTGIKIQVESTEQPLIDAINSKLEFNSTTRSFYAIPDKKIEVDIKALFELARKSVKFRGFGLPYCYLSPENVGVYKDGLIGVYSEGEHKEVFYITKNLEFIWKSTLIEKEFLIKRCSNGSDDDFANGVGIAYTAFHTSMFFKYLSFLSEKFDTSWIGAVCLDDAEGTSLEIEDSFRRGRFYSKKIAMDNEIKIDFSLDKAILKSPQELEKHVLSILDELYSKFNWFESMGSAVNTDVAEVLKTAKI